MKITLNNCFAIFIKELKDATKNGQIILLFFMFPIISLIMSSSIQMEGIEPQFFLIIFATMHIVFSPIVVTSTILAEEKEKGTLRLLLMNNVSPIDYLISIGGFVFILTLSTSFIFLAIGNFTLNQSLYFLMMMGLGSLISILIGMIIGGSSKNMIASDATAVPIAMFFAFLPMLASFDLTIKRITMFLYSGILSELLTNSINWSIQNGLFLLLNALIFIVIFFRVFKANRLDA